MHVGGAAGLPGSDGDPRPDPAAGPDPAAADLRLGARRLRSEKPIRVTFDSGAGGTSPGQPYPTFEESFNEFPIPGTQAKAWYLAPGGNLKSTKPPPARTPTNSPGTRARCRCRTSAATPARRRRPLDGDPDLPLGTEPARLGRLLRDRTAERKHDRDRRRRGEPLGALLDPERRPPGDGQRGAPGRQGDLRAERLGAGGRAQARRGQVDARSSRSSACANPTSNRCPRTNS